MRFKFKRVIDFLGRVGQGLNDGFNGGFAKKNRELGLGGSSDDMFKGSDLGGGFGKQNKKNRMNKYG